MRSLESGLHFARRESLRQGCGFALRNKRKVNCSAEPTIGARCGTGQLSGLRYRARGYEAEVHRTSHLVRRQQRLCLTDSPVPGQQRYAVGHVWTRQAADRDGAPHNPRACCMSSAIAGAPANVHAADAVKIELKSFMSASTGRLAASTQLAT